MEQTTTTAAVKQSNDLRYSTSKVIGKEHIYVKIRLNDEYKNGHQDFAITGDIYRAGKPKTDSNHIAGGCIHDDILKAWPEFKIFVDLHLCDCNGIPMYAVENGFYHMNDVGSAMSKERFCEYYRITPEQYDSLKTAQNKLQFALALQSLGILEQWDADAKKGIEILEGLTETKFINDSKKSQYHAPTPEQLQEEEEKQRTGYYTPEAKAAREQEKIDKLLAELAAQRDKAIQKHFLEFEVKKQVLLTGGTAALNNCIFYNHSNTLTFNWRSYDMLPQETVDDIINRLTLPKGIKVEDRKGKDR
jgi:hypothetical protein